MTKTEISFFNAAKAVSELSNHKYRVGAVVVKSHKIVSSGCNSSTRTDIIQAKLDRQRYGCECPGKLHAESDALIPFIKRKIDLSGASIYIYRQLKDGSYAMARPCPSCMKLIKMCQIKRIYYTTYGGYAKEEIDIV